MDERVEAPRDYEELIRVIHDRYDGMSKSYQKIALYLTQNPNDVAVRSVNSIGESCGVHASSFVRFAQALGYEGFKELQSLFQRRLSTAAPGFEARIKALETELGTSYYARIDAPASAEEKARLKTLSPEAVREGTLAGEPITAKLTRAPGNGAPIDGLKIVTASGWFAARPSGTESVYKIYAESFNGTEHLDALLSEAQDLVDTAIGGSK